MNAISGGLGVFDVNTWKDYRKSNTTSATETVVGTFFTLTWIDLDLFTPNGKNNAGLSNITLFGTAAPIPLSAAAWLRIGGFGAVVRKRKSARA